MLAIIDDTLCCIWGLARCGGSADSGLRIKAKDVSNDSTKVILYGGNCYTILTNITTCGTVLASSAYTIVTGCSDSSCPATSCPIQPCASTSTSYTIGGLAGVIGPSVPFGSPYSCRINGCSTEVGAWDNIVYRNGNHASTGCPGTGTWFIDNNLYTPGGFSPEIATNDGNKLCVNCTLSCAGHFGTDLGWYIDVGVGSACDSFPGATATYYNPGPSPAGTYTLVSGGASISWPATITAS